MGIIIYASPLSSDWSAPQQDRLINVTSFIVGLDQYIDIAYGQSIAFEVNNFSNGVGAFCAKYMRRPFQWITEPIHRDCRWWDQHLLQKALQRQMDAVQTVLDEEDLCEDVCGVIVDFMVINAAIRTMAKERDFAVVQANAMLLAPATVRQLCAQRFHSQIPCIFISCPWGPASI